MVEHTGKSQLTAKQRRIWRLCKVVLWVGGLYVLWQILLSNTVSNAILAFLLDGEVPATDIVLSPEVVLWSVGITFATMIFLTFVVVYRRHRQGHAPDLLAIRVAAAQLVLAQTVVRPKPKKAKKVPQTKFVAAMPAPAKVMPRWHSWLRLAWRRALGGVRRVGHYLAVYILGGYELVRLGSLKLWAKIRQGLRAFWTWAEPYLLAIDTWLGVQLLQAEAWTRRFVREHQDMAFVREQAREARKLLRDSWLTARGWSKSLLYKLKSRFLDQ